MMVYLIFLPVYTKYSLHLFLIPPKIVQQFSTKLTIPFISYQCQWDFTNQSFLFISFIYSWYFRKIKRIEAEKKLLLPENEHGAFLIRDSESRHNDYSLSGKQNASNEFNLICKHVPKCHANAKNLTSYITI